MIFFTADPHFFHNAVLDFERRPFSTIEEMNNEIIKRWNVVVSNKDDIYILGDISFGKKAETTALLKLLNGRKYLINGNHDKLNLEQKELFVWTKDYYKLKALDHKFILFHYPIFAWDRKEKGSIHLHGHTHGNSHDDIEIENKINVGMDLWSYAPVSIEEILSKTI